jgi:stress response protein YsnF
MPDVSDDKGYPDTGMAASERPDGDRQTLEIAQEFASVGVVREEVGTVRVRTLTDVFDSVVPATLRAEAIEVTRHRIDREVDAAPEPRTEGELTIIPVVEERAVVVTRLFVTEEIHIRRKVEEETVELPVSLRRQRAVVERFDPDGAPRPAQPGDEPDATS